jgi:hypothetical protein
MASKQALLSALFDQFTSFLTELKEMYPADTDFPVFVTSIRITRNTNPIILPKYISELGGKYEEQIMKKDEQFFLNNQYSEYSSYVNMDIFGKLKHYFSNMSTESKENVWKYCQNILRLTKAYHS